MKIAIVHDWLVTYAGAEKVLTEILNCYPEADLFALIDFMPENQRHLILNKKVKTTFIQHLPLAKKKYRSYLSLMPLAIEQLNLSAYDLIISCSHAIAKGIITGPAQLHISYVHSPMRYCWDLQHQYLKESGLKSGLKGIFAKYILHKMRIWDYRTANGVDHFISNSKYISKRIWKIYRRESEVIYPPVDTQFFKPNAVKQDFYLAASRLVPYKKIDLIAKAFANMPEKKLVIIGDGPDAAKVKAALAPNIQFLGYQPNEILVNHLQQAKAFIFAAEEDFGILPVEAQACGTPVIAYGKGGALETVLDDINTCPTGVFFKDQTTDSICDAVSYFEKHIARFTSENCVKQASNFATLLFQKKFKDFIQQKLNKN